MNTNERTERNRENYMNVSICDKNTYFEVPLEYSFPDYQPEIRRLLSVDATVLPPTKYIGGKNVEFSGNIDFRIIYVGGDGSLYSLPISAEYDYSVPFDNDIDDNVELGSGVSAFSFPSVENISTRVMSPNKITLKARVSAHTRAYGRVSLENELAGADAKMCKKTNVCQNIREEQVFSDTVELSDEIYPVSPDTRIIFADAKPFINEINKKGDRLEYRGEVYLKLLAENEEGENMRQSEMLRKIPFICESDEIAGASEWIQDADLCGDGYINDLSINVSEDKIVVTADMSTDVRVLANIPVGYTEDTYSVEYECKNSIWNTYSPSLASAGNYNFSVNERLSRADMNIPEGAEVVTCMATTIMDRGEQKEGRFSLGGSTKFSVVIKKDGEYSVCEVVLPQKFEVEGKAVTGFDLRCSSLSPKAFLDGDNVTLSCEVYMSAEMLGTCGIRAVKYTELGEAIEKSVGDMIIYYPEKNEEIWDIAKKYKVEESQVIFGKNGKYTMVNI